MSLFFHTRRDFNTLKWDHKIKCLLRLFYFIFFENHKYFTFKESPLLFQTSGS